MNLTWLTNLLTRLFAPRPADITVEAHGPVSTMGEGAKGAPRVAATNQAVLRESAINPPPPIPPVPRGDASRIATVLSALDWTEPSVWADILVPHMADAAITAPRRVAAFMACCTVESGGGRALSESMAYSVERILAVFSRGRISEADARRVGAAPGRAADQKALANLVYGGEWGRKNLGNIDPGDGWRFRGGGLIQMTGRANYARVAATLGITVDVLEAAVRTRDGAAQSACRWWQLAGLNGLADQGDITGVRRRVAGSDMGLAEVKAAYAKALAAL